MKILRLRAKGFIGLKKGLDVDEIDTDLSNLSGLIAISGGNGFGKTSWLELLTPYPCLFSRSPTFKNHVFLRDSFRTIDIEYEGSLYECTVKIDSDSGKSEGYIKRDGKSLTDGKISTYTQEVEKIFGSRTLFENSIFCSQGSKSIADFTTGQLKSLFSEFLQLDKLVEYEKTSKQCISVITTIASRIEKEMESLKDRINDKANVGQKLSDAEKQADVLKQELKRTEETLERLKSDFTAINDKISKSMVKKSQLEDLEKNLSRFKSDRGREFGKTEDELNRLRNNLRDINDDIKKCEKLLADKDKIIEAWNQETEITEMLDIVSMDLEQRKNELDKVDNEINDIIKTIDENRRIIDAGKKDPEISRLEAEISGKREKTVDLEKRDQECKSEICSFIVGALKAQDELPVLEKELSARIDLRQKQDQKCNNTVEKLSEELEGKKSDKVLLSKQHKALKSDKETADEKLKKIRLLSIKKPDIAVAISQRDDLEKRKTEITTEGIRIKDNRDKAIARIDYETKNLNTEIEDLKGSIDNTLNEKKEKIDQQIKSTSEAMQDVNANIADTNESIAVLRQERTNKATAERDLAIKKDEYDKYLHEQSEWIYLRNSCSKDGIQALEIDSVAPMISSNTNEILNMSFGPAYSVKLRTQTEDGREALDIIIIGEDGEEVLLDNMSGGQKCWILMCIRLAMTLISKMKSGKKFLTGFSDEIDGQLDVGRAIDFMKMYRAFMQLGGFESFYFISHKPECTAMADHVLNFGNGGITID